MNYRYSTKLQIYYFTYSLLSTYFDILSTQYGITIVYHIRMSHGSECCCASDLLPSGYDIAFRSLLVHIKAVLSCSYPWYYFMYIVKGNEHFYMRTEKLIDSYK